MIFVENKIVKRSKLVEIRKTYVDGARKQKDRVIDLILGNE